MTEAADLDLLARHEPILRFTDGELFFPMGTGPYVEECDLLTGPTLREARVAIPAGELDLERLAAVGDPAPGEAQFLRFVPHPLNALELRRWQSRPEHQRFSAPGRLARVGLAARLVDAGLVTSLLLRGRVPGGTAAAASDKYDRDPRDGPEGRVSRPGHPRRPLGRPPLHVLLRDERLALHVRGRQRPRGGPRAVLRRVRGARRRRRCGRPGSAPPPTTRRATTCGGAGTTRGWRRSTAIRSSTRAPARTRPTSSAASTSCCCRSRASGTSAACSTSSGSSGATRSPSRTRATWRRDAKRALSVPFVDYARGDGLAVGPGGDVAWSPVIIGDETAGSTDTAGLWGLDTGDRFAGERAPAGPKYTRTGSVRQSWHDPLGFAGLDKVAPPSQAVAVLEAPARGADRERGPR